MSLFLMNAQTDLHPTTWINLVTTNKRLRNIIRYNPPFSKSLATNIEKKFLKLICEEFKHSIFYKWYNKNNIKISYCCVNNIGNIISANNRSMQSGKEGTPPVSCNCRIRERCSLNSNCRVRSVVYHFVVLDSKY